MTEGIQINKKHIQIFLMSARFKLETAQRKVLKAKQAALRSGPSVRRGGGGGEKALDFSPPVSRNGRRCAAEWGRCGAGPGSRRSCWWSTEMSHSRHPLNSPGSSESQLRHKNKQPAFTSTRHHVSVWIKQFPFSFLSCCANKLQSTADVNQVLQFP